MVVVVVLREGCFLLWLYSFWLWDGDVVGGS